MNLVLVESPTKARMLSSFLGEGYRVEATMGHLRDLPESKLGVTMTERDGSFAIKPEYILIKEKEDRVKDLRTLFKKADSTILATDPDREGEAIAWHTAVLLNGEQSTINNQPSTNFQRVVFHQITKNAILEAMKHPRGLDVALVDAQQTRRVLDRVVGYELSPLLWKKVRRGLSAGRVQSVAVRIIVDREREIEAFKAEEYWEVYVEVSKVPEVPKVSEVSEAFQIKLISIGEEKVELHKKEEADPIVESLNKAMYTVSSVEEKEARRSPFPPFTTSTLQQAGARLFHWSGKKTMSVAQQLYEHGFITYHRTDSVHLAKEAIDSVRAIIPDKYGAQYLSESARMYKTKSKLAQEAHEAIRVTHLSDIDRAAEIESRIGRFGKEAVRLYDLVWRRFVATQMADQVFDQTMISVTASRDDKTFGLEARGQVEKFEGWKTLYQRQPSTINNQQSTISQGQEGEQIMLPSVHEGEELKKIKVIPGQHFTQPPPRYSEAGLIKILEKHGIGRPSTYAPTISTIQDRGYVVKEEGTFRPTPVGLVVNDFLVKYFPNIVDVDFTREMEDDLDNIALKKKDWQQVIGSFWQPFETHLMDVESKAERVRVPVEDTGLPCPTCQEGTQVIRSGRFGKFLSCSRFPKCKWTANFVEKIGMKCPDCKAGDVIVKKTRKGKQFYGCSRYPECKWASWRKPTLRREAMEGKEGGEAA